MRKACSPLPCLGNLRAKTMELLGLLNSGAVGESRNNSGHCELPLAVRHGSRPCSHGTFNGPPSARYASMLIGLVRYRANR